MQAERASRIDWGLAVSAGTHATLLLATLLAFSDARRFDDAQEALAVEVVTQSELNQIMRGEKTAKPAETPRTRAEQQAERVEQKPETPTEQATRDVPVPPPPLRREPDPGDAAERAPPAPTPPPAPPRVAAIPPAPPEPQKRPEPPRPEPKPEPPKAEAKPDRPEPEKAEPVPQPPRRPEPPKQEAKPAPPPAPRARPVEQKPPEPKAAETPRPKDEKPRLDQVAKLLDDKKREEQKTPAKPRTGDEDQPPSRYDPASIRKMLSREASQQTASSGREVARTASLGTATASAQRMSPSLWGQLDGLLQEQYRECWNKLGLDGQRYVPQIRVTYNPDGSLASQPVLVNPPAESSHRSLADSAMRAVQRCNPLKIPPQFAPYHAQWRARTLRFDPEEM